MSSEVSSAARAPTRRTLSALEIVFLALAVLASAPRAVAQVYDVYKNSTDGTPIPDVNKFGVPPGPAAPGDMSCWQATAANILGAAGWGVVGNTAQQNATAIYGHMTGHFTTANMGAADLAINWWLYNYGLNPGAPAGWYRTDVSYTDVTRVNGQLLGPTYDHLLDELTDCQYVGVQWTLAPPLTGDHCMTLVGGNYTNTAKPTGQVSVWHDSDRDLAGGVPSDDVYGNNFAGGWTLPAYPTQGAFCYVELCPGLQKPEEAVSNYDAAWIKDQTPAGNVIEAWVVAGDNGQQWGTPTWSEDFLTIDIPNEEILEKQKEVYLLVDFLSQGYTLAMVPNITLLDENGILVDTRTVTLNADGGQALYSWTIDHQPGHETIVFPDTNFHELGGDIKDFNLATICVPEPGPSLLLLLAAAGAGLVAARRRRGCLDRA